MNIWSIALDASGRATSQAPLITSTFRDSDPDYSPDGRKIAFTSGRAGGFGIWVYFASASSRNLEVWKVPAGGGLAVQVTRKGGFEGFETADGQYLYYLKGRGIPGIWRAPTAGGEEVPVTDRDQAGLWRCWRLAGGGIYFGTAAPPEGARLEFLDLATGGVREILRTGKAPDLTIPSLAVAPDGRHLLYAQYDQSGSNIMMVEDFR